MLSSDTMFLLVFLFLGVALAISVWSYRYTTYRLAVSRGRSLPRVARPFWLS